LSKFCEILKKGLAKILAKKWPRGKPRKFPFPRHVASAQTQIRERSHPRLYYDFFLKKVFDVIPVTPWRNDVTNGVCCHLAKIKKIKNKKTKVK
jgi:hypothetical protein